MLIRLFSVLELTAESRVFHQSFQLAEIVQLFDPAIANPPSHQAREPRIVRYHEATRRNAVSDVKKLLRPELKEVMQSGFLQQLGMEFGYSVDFMAANRGKISHANISFAAFINQRHPRNTRWVVAKFQAHLIQETTIDFVNNL